jgi:spore germination cell wall hydrolase CwlJ-like protein
MSWAILGFFSFITIASIILSNSNSNSNDIEVEETTSASIEQVTEDVVSTPSEEIEESTTEEVITEEPTTTSWEDLIHQMNEEVDNIPYDFNDMQQKQQWFLAYKEVIAKYPKELHMITIYEAYSQEDLALLYGVVQAEVGDEYSFVEKVNVISVMFNRLNSGKYSSLREVLTAPKQFASVVKGKKIDEKTILACEYVFLFGDTTNGCMAFKMSKQNKWYNWTYQFSDGCHHFYK